MQAFFGKLGAMTRGTFSVTPITATPVGDELIVNHNRNTLTVDGQTIETEVVVVWRVVDGRLAEVWDIPSVHAGARAIS